MTDPVPSKEQIQPCLHGRTPGLCRQCMRDENEHLRRENVRWENAHKILLSENERLRALRGTCLGGCGTVTPSNDAYCSACFLKARAEQRRPAHEREMPHCSTCSCPPYQAPEPAAVTKRMRIAFQPQGRCLWHEDCPASSSGVMREVQHEDSRSLLQCLICGQQGYYPKGAVGSVCVDVIGCSAQPPEGVQS